MPDGSQNCGCLAWRGNRRCPNIPDRGGSTGDTVRLVTFRHSPTGDRDHVGALIDGDSAVVDLGISPGGPAFDSMLALIRAGDEALAAARPAAANPRADAVVAAEEIALRTPLPEPPQIRDCLCFEEHLKRAFEVLRKSRGDGSPGMFEIPEIWYRQPIYYKANRLTVVGHGEDVLWPGYAETMDYELEFGFFIGAGGRDIAKRDARAHIFGYSIFNDFSARDAQAREMPGGLGPGKGKDFDTGNVIGPCIVTADELDPYDCTMIARVNGEEWSRGHSGSIHWTFEDLIAHVSQSETLHPGEFFGSGTVGGGCGLELGRYLSDGDTIELEVEGIGILRNRLIREA